MIDEIIETDPDEAQHHPIVDGDAYEDEHYNPIPNAGPGSKSFKEDESSQKFDGYDSTFFNKQKNSPP
jgi:hypothetical protein